MVLPIEINTDRSYNCRVFMKRRLKYLYKTYVEKKGNRKSADLIYLIIVMH
jgi:hypothetical protein